MAHEARTDDLLEENLRPEYLQECRVAILLEPERARILVRISRVERRLGPRALEIGADDRRVGERAALVVPPRDLTEGADLPVDLAGKDRLVIVRDVLLSTHHPYLAHEGGSADAVECRHGRTVCPVRRTDASPRSARAGHGLRRRLSA